jgi:hypothetical protein
MTLAVLALLFVLGVFLAGWEIPTVLLVWGTLGRLGGSVVWGKIERRRRMKLWLAQPSDAARNELLSQPLPGDWANRYSIGAFTLLTALLALLGWETLGLMDTCDLTVIACAAGLLVDWLLEPGKQQLREAVHDQVLQTSRQRKTLVNEPTASADGNPENKPDEGGRWN